MTILGEVLAGIHPNKLVKIVLRERVVDAPGPAPLEPPNEHVDYLRERGAFILPSRATWYVAPFHVAIISPYFH